MNNDNEKLVTSTDDLPENEAQTAEAAETTEAAEAAETAEATDAAETAETAEAGEKPEKAKKPKKEKTKKEKKVQRTRNLRRLRYGTTSTIVTVVVIAAVILFNVIVGIVAERHPISIDLSADKVYTLTDSSKQIAKAVDKDVQIVVFYPESTFSSPNTGSDELDTVLREFYNALRQYDSLSGGKVTYKFIDPEREPAAYAAYSKYDVQSGSILFLCGDMHKTSDLSSLYETEQSSYYSQATISASKVEQVLGSNINVLTGGKEHVVQVLTGHGEDSDLISGLKSLYELNGYTFKELNIAGSAEFDENAEVLLIPAPSKDYSDDEIKRVQQWVFNDGSYNRGLYVFTNTTASCPNLYEFLKVEYQITVTDELLLETDFNRVYSNTSIYPFADVPDNEFTANSTSTGKLLTPQARRLTTTLEGPKDDGTLSTYGVKLTSYPSSARLIRLADAQSTESGSKTYKADDADYPLTSMIACVIDSYNNNTQQSAKGTIVVCGSPMMGISTVIKTNAFKNEDLLLDTINTMTGSEGTVSISTKSLKSKTVSFSGGTQLAVGIGVFTVGLPVVILIVALAVFIRRKNL